MYPPYIGLSLLSRPLLRDINVRSDYLNARLFPAQVEP